MPYHENKAFQDNKHPFLADDTVYRVVISSFYKVPAEFFYSNRLLRMSSSSNVYCCVPRCNQKGYVEIEWDFLSFPKDPNICKQWLQKTRADVGPDFSLTKATKVCSSHCRGEEIKTGIAGKKVEFVKGAIPWRFAWRTSSRKRHPP